MPILPASVRLESAPIPHFVVKNALAEAVICLQGAQVMHFAPAGQHPLLWAADPAHWGAGKNLRGGVPVCWPWFGPHQTDKGLPQHGWVRQREWRVEVCEELPDGRTRLVFKAPGAGELADWPAGLSVSLEITIGHTLQLRLTSRNGGDSPVRFEDALHTYFAVSDVRHITVHGLGGLPYQDQFDGMARKMEAAGAVRIAGPVCRTYLGQAPVCAIEDAAMGRRIVITATGSRSSVLWNPGEKIAATMADLGSQWPRMVCLETANCLDGAQVLAPGAEQVTAATYAIESL